MTFGLDLATLVFFLAGVAVVFAATGAIAVSLVNRHRMPLWRRKRLELEEAIIDEGPRRALIRLRLQLEEAVSLARSVILDAEENAGELHYLGQRVEGAASRIARHIDVLLQSGTDDLLRLVVDGIRARVRATESAAAMLADAASRAITGSAAIEVEGLVRDIRGKLDLIDLRVQALRELSDDEQDWLDRPGGSTNE